MELSEIRELLANGKKKAAMAEIRKVASQYCADDEVTCYTRGGRIFVRITADSFKQMCWGEEAAILGLSKLGISTMPGGYKFNEYSQKELGQWYGVYSSKSISQVDLTDFLK